MGIFARIFGKSSSDNNNKLNLGNLKNLDDITLDDMKNNPIWINDVSGEWEDEFDESSERPVLGATDITKGMRSEFISISMLVEFPNDDAFGSANLEDDGTISCVAIWENNEWVDGRKAFQNKDNVDIKLIPTVEGEANILFVYDPKSDKGKRK